MTVSVPANQQLMMIELNADPTVALSELITSDHSIPIPLSLPMPMPISLPLPSLPLSSLPLSSSSSGNKSMKIIHKQINCDDNLENTNHYISPVTCSSSSSLLSLSSISCHSKESKLQIANYQYNDYELNTMENNQQQSSMNKEDCGSKKAITIFDANNVNNNNKSSEKRLEIDTNLANIESGQQREESYQNKTILAQKILSVIRNDDFEQFSFILRCMKPDLNVFINGQTALHYCLLLGKSYTKYLALLITIY